MIRQYRVYLILIAILLAVNLIRWGMQVMPWSGGTLSETDSFSPEDFNLYIAADATSKSAKRDLFAVTGNRDAGKVLHVKRVASVVQKKTAEIAVKPESSTTVQPRVKLLGVVFRSGVGQAFIADENESVLAHMGDRIFGHYSVDKIEVDAVDLKDLNSNLSRRIPLSGK